MFGFLKKLLGATDSEPRRAEPAASSSRESSTAPGSSTPAVMAEIKKLVDEAGRYYPHADPKRALELFRQAVTLAPSAPVNKELHQEIDFGDVGHAVWAGWVCLDLMEAGYEEFDDWMALADAKSPATADRIRARLEEVAEARAEDSRKESELSEALLAFRQAISDDDDVAKAPDALIAVCREQSAWWTLRDEARSLSKSGHRDVAWALANAAVSICIENGRGNLSSIREVMGDITKRDGRYRRACEMFLLAVAESNGSPSKNSQNQLRICLKKAGFKTDAETVRDELVQVAMSLGYKEAESILASKTALLGT